MPSHSHEAAWLSRCCPRRTAISSTATTSRLSKRIVQDGEILGTMYFNTAYEPFARLRDYVGILSLVLVLSLVAAALMSSRLQKTLTAPILDVTEIAKRVMEQRNFSLRARRMSDDEVGVLVTAFNGMLGEIGKQTEALEASNQQLQREFAERQRAEEAKERTERRVRTLVSVITQVVWVADRARLLRRGARVLDRRIRASRPSSTRVSVGAARSTTRAVPRSTSRGLGRWRRRRRSSSNCACGTPTPASIGSSDCARCR